ncbi:hypothetical protein CEW46_21460 [Bacillus cereus]|nr:hypothetical protein CEW46_21460 [Bacillus cereus]
MSNLSSPKGRVGGNSVTDYLRPTVKLTGVTANPVGVLFSLWHGSRNMREVESEDAQRIYEGKIEYVGQDVFKWIDICKYIIGCYPEHSELTTEQLEYLDDATLNHLQVAASKVIGKVAKMNIIANVPSAESVNFTFSIENATVAFREQLVRSKLASYWTQTSRTANLTAFDSNRSESIEMYGGEEAVKVYDETVQKIREAYKQLGELGVPVEEIRLAPESRVHRVYWMISARALLPIISKRTSWIAQSTLWTPVIADVYKILREVDPLFTEFFGKNDDCKIENGEVVFYKYDNEIEDRYYERDYQPVDPIWLARHKVALPEHTDIMMYDHMKSMYIQLWNDEILDILGWDRKNPTELGPYDRPVSYWLEHDPTMLNGLDNKYTPIK